MLRWDLPGGRRSEMGKQLNKLSRRHEKHFFPVCCSAIKSGYQYNQNFRRRCSVIKSDYQYNHNFKDLNRDKMEQRSSTSNWIEDTYNHIFRRFKDHLITD